MKEKLIIDQEEFILASSPIKAFLKSLETKANEISLDVPEKKIPSAVWLIRNNVLYMQSFEPLDESIDENNLASSFYRTSNSAASWFTGILIAQTGEITWYRNGIEPMYEKELILKVESGVVVNHEVRFNECPF